MANATTALPPQPVADWFSMSATSPNAAGSRWAKVMIYDAIGGWFGIKTSEFVKELNALDVDEIELHLNSPGGAAFDGIAIHNALRQHQAKVTVIVDGLAASAASIVAMGADEIAMARGSQLMIHDATAIAWGSAAAQRKTAAVLDKLSAGMAAVYAAKAGGTPEEWRAAMLAETWYNAEEAVKAGLADRTDDATAEATARFDLSAYRHPGRASAPAPRIPTRSGVNAAPRMSERDRAASRLADLGARAWGFVVTPAEVREPEPLSAAELDSIARRAWGL